MADLPNTPETRREQFLNAIATGNTSGLPEPVTREEVYLDYIADTAASPYQNTGIYPIYSVGRYINAFGYSEDFDFLFVPCEIGGDSNLPVGDYFYNSGTNWRVGILSGHWYNGAIAGAFTLAFHSDASVRSRDIGGRLVYVPSNE